MNVFMVEEGHSCAKGGARTRGMQGASHRGEFGELVDCIGCRSWTLENV
jgi:hypothetical protein